MYSCRWRKGMLLFSVGGEIVFFGKEGKILVGRNFWLYNIEIIDFENSVEGVLSFYRVCVF